MPNPMNMRIRNEYVCEVSVVDDLIRENSGRLVSSSYCNIKTMQYTNLVARPWLNQNESSSAKQSAWMCDSYIVNNQI